MLKCKERNPAALQRSALCSTPGRCWQIQNVCNCVIIYTESSDDVSMLMMLSWFFVAPIMQNNAIWELTVAGSTIEGAGSGLHFKRLAAWTHGAAAYTVLVAAPMLSRRWCHCSVLGLHIQFGCKRPCLVTTSWVKNHQSSLTSCAAAPLRRWLSGGVGCFSCAAGGRRGARAGCPCACWPPPPPLRTPTCHQAAWRSPGWTPTAWR